MIDVNITITEDEALVLFEFFERFKETNNLSVTHPAEFIALMKISAQIDKSLVVMFQPNYLQLLEEARQRMSVGFEGDVPGMDNA